MFDSVIIAGVSQISEKFPPPFVKKNVKNRRPPVKNVKNVINPRPASNRLAVGDRFTSASLE
jgi:hypothetical protein